MKQRIKYRWIVLFAVASAGLLAVVIALGVPLRKGITPSAIFVLLAMMLIVPIPMSVTRIVKHRWGTPIIALWCFPMMIAIYFMGSRSMGFGHQCDDVVLVANIAGFCLTNACWAIDKLRQRVVTSSRRELVRSIQVSIVPVV